MQDSKFLNYLLAYYTYNFNSVFPPTCFLFTPSGICTPTHTYMHLSFS